MFAMFQTTDRQYINNPLLHFCCAQILTWRCMFLLDIILLQTGQLSWSPPRCFSLTCLLQLDWTLNSEPQTVQVKPDSDINT